MQLHEKRSTERAKVGRGAEKGREGGGRLARYGRTMGFSCLAKNSDTVSRHEAAMNAHSSNLFSVRMALTLSSRKKTRFSAINPLYLHTTQGGVGVVKRGRRTATKKEMEKKPAQTRVGRDSWESWDQRR